MGAKPSTAALAARFPKPAGLSAVVTGGNRGLGLATVQGLVDAGCRNLCVATRSAASIPETVASKDGTEVKVFPIELDLASNESCATAAEGIATWLREGGIDHLDVVVLNGGVMYREGEVCEDGTDLTFSTNVRGHFLFSHLLLPYVKLSPEGGRIIWVASGFHRQAVRMDLDVARGKKPARTSLAPGEAPMYAQSKAANVMMASEMARRLQAQGDLGTRVFSCEPGFVKTDLFRSNWLAAASASVAGRRVEHGAATQLYLAIGEDIDGSGGYFADCKPATASRLASDLDEQTKLYQAMVVDCGEHLSDKLVLPEVAESKAEIE